MKKVKVILSALLLTLTFGAGSAMAADSATLTVTATVLASCSFDANGTMALGNLDPTGGDVTTSQAGVITYACTQGAAPTLAVPATGSMTGTTNGDSLPFGVAYTDTFDAVASTGSIDFDVTVTAANMLAVSADSYSGSITLNITP